MATRIIARFAIGAESAEHRLSTSGHLVVEYTQEDWNFRVYVNGGTLPDGEEAALFDSKDDAMRYALEQVALLVAAMDDEGEF